MGRPPLTKDVKQTDLSWSREVVELDCYLLQSAQFHMAATNLVQKYLKLSVLLILTKDL